MSDNMMEKDVVKNIVPVRKNFIYNVLTPSKTYLNVYEGGHIFTEYLETDQSPREAWERMLLELQAEKIKADKQGRPFVRTVFVPSIEALRAKDQKHFDELVHDVVKYDGCTLFASKENAFFNKTNPKGISHDMAQLESAKKKLQEQWDESKPGIEIVSIKRKRSQNITEKMLEKKIFQI